MGIFTTLRGEITIVCSTNNKTVWKSIVCELLPYSVWQSYVSGNIYYGSRKSCITTCIVKTWTSVAKMPRVPVENQITTLSVVEIATKFGPIRDSVETLGEREKCRQEFCQKSHREFRRESWLDSAGLFLKLSVRLLARLLVRLSARLSARLFALAKRLHRVSDRIIYMTFCMIDYRWNALYQ